MTTNDSLTLLGLLSFGAMPLIVLGYMARKAYRQGFMLRAVVLSITAVHELILIIFPAWYSGFHNYKLEAEFGGEPGELLVVIIGEAIFVASFVALFAFNSRKKSKILTNKLWISRNNIVLLYVLLLAGIIFSARYILMPGFTTHDMAYHADIIIRIKILEIARTWAASFVYWPSIIAASLVVAFPFFPKRLRWLGGILLLLRMSSSLIDGFRGGILLILGLLISFGLLSNRRRFVYALIIIVMLSIPLMPWVQQIMRYETATASKSGISRIEMLPNVFRMISEYIRGDVILPTNRSFMESWVLRAQGARNSIVLYKLYDQDQSAGVHPLFGAMIMPIPRAIFPDKPVAGSTDSTNLGAAIFRVQQAKPYSSYQDMGPLTASAHAYWEGGLLWVVLSGFITGFFWSSILKWAEKSSSVRGIIIVFGFMAALPIDGFFSMLNPLYTYVRIIWTLIIPIFLLDKFLQLFRSLRIMPLAHNPVRNFDLRS